MMSLNANQEIKSITLEAQVRRADGTIENLGPVAEYNHNPKKKSSLLGDLTLNIKNSALYQRYLMEK